MDIPEASSPPAKAPLVTYVFSTGRGGLFSRYSDMEAVCDMEAVLKQNDMISRSRYQLHRRPIGRRLFPVSLETANRAGRSDRSDFEAFRDSVENS
jgi:hypothetical protein